MTNHRSAGPPASDPWTWIFLVSGLGNLANGLWMLADPAHWYATLPAAVPDFGPLNEHFVRDIGSAFTMLGVGTGLGRVPLGRAGARARAGDALQRRCTRSCTSTTPAAAWSAPSIGASTSPPSTCRRPC